MVIRLKKPKGADKKAQTPPKNIEPIEKTPTEQPKPSPPSTELQETPFTPFIDSIVMRAIIDDVSSQQKAFAALCTYAHDPTAFTASIRKAGFSRSIRIKLTHTKEPKNNPILSWAQTFATPQPASTSTDNTNDKAPKNGANVVANAIPSLSAKAIGTPETGGRVTEFRVQLWPRAMSPYCFSELHGALMNFMDDGLNFLIENGNVTQIEVSVDMFNVEMSQVHLLPASTTTASTWSKDGLLETIVIGKKISGVYTRVYDRGRKREDGGQFDPKYKGVRVERVTKPNMKLKRIPLLKNPLDRIEMVVMPDQPSWEKKTYLWEFFKDAVQRRSLPVALKLMQGGPQTRYRKLFEQHLHPKWNSKEIWAKWPQYLVDCGLFWNTELDALLTKAAEKPTKVKTTTKK